MMVRSIPHSPFISFFLAFSRYLDFAPRLSPRCRSQSFIKVPPRKTWCKCRCFRFTTQWLSTPLHVSLDIRSTFVYPATAIPRRAGEELSFLSLVDKLAKLLKHAKYHPGDWVRQHVRPTWIPWDWCRRWVVNIIDGMRRLPTTSVVLRVQKLCVVPR